MLLALHGNTSLEKREHEFSKPVFLKTTLFFRGFIDLSIMTTYI
jgi:hypothetical protein